MSLAAPQAPDLDSCPSVPGIPHRQSRRTKPARSSRPKLFVLSNRSRQRSSLSFRRSRPDHAPAVPVIIPPDYASLQYSCSAYNTYNCHLAATSTDCLAAPARLPPPSQSSCPRLDRFSWQARTSTTTHLRPKRHHVEIVIPDWARTVERPPSLYQLPNLDLPNELLWPSQPPLSPPPTPKGLGPAFPHFSYPRPPSATSSASDKQGVPCTGYSGRNVQVEHARQQTKALHRVINFQKPPLFPLPPISQPLPISPPVSTESSPVRRQPTMSAENEKRSPAVANTPSTPNLGSASGANSLSGLVCNVHRTTGSKPPALVGASTTVSGDKLYVFGGRRLSKRKTQLTADMYELDLISRHWTMLQTKGKVPAPRYFHTVCALGDTKLVCYGGMASASHVPADPNAVNPSAQAEPGIIVMSDVHFFDIATSTWTLISTTNAPPGRYAHCATILPSHSVFTSTSAPLSAVKQPSGSFNAGQNITIEGRGGAEMIIVGGQDGESNYIQQISVFNLRSLTWTSTTPLAKQCGAYRSVVAPMVTLKPSQVGAWAGGREPLEQDDDDESPEGHTTLVYSNYNFLDVRLELQLRLPDGTIVEKPMKGAYMPPGLRFPHGEIIANHFVISGTLITSNRQEYAIWALDLRTLQWSRIDAGPGILNNGSWNRGLLWKKRSQFVVLGDRRRRLDEDYNHRRLNFRNLCTIEMEAFGLYDNPVTTAPAVGFGSASCPVGNLPELPVLDRPAQSDSAYLLGRSAAELREISDMDFLALGGERVSVNFHIVARRWGPYLTQLLDGATKRPTLTVSGDDDDEERRNTVLANHHLSRNSSITITPGSVASFSNTVSSALDGMSSPASRPSTSSETVVNGALPASYPGDADASLAPLQRSRVLFLPHTVSTVRALVYYLYTWTLPAPGTPLCTPQILCSLLQVARPYRVNGLLEALVERLHQSFDGKSTAAIFNAAAMAAGGGDALAFDPADPRAAPGPSRPVAAHALRDAAQRRKESAASMTDSEDDGAGAGGMSSMASSASSLASLDPHGHVDGVGEIWTGELSSVVGLQKRGLRGLMEGRAARDRMLGDDGTPGTERSAAGANGSGAPAVGLGIGS